MGVEVMGLFRHIFFLFVLAVLCYLLAITVATSQAAFVMFLVVGVLFELVFWVQFWRQRKNS